ncbi:carboxypeptidase M-like [Hippocampus zosterae]|uniref:carboxypeptidase M-like n=1 Tax=Hippocampus zosterae TaxID=109293 RepID=UPI00223D290E|nr:carboxypeptidase M-like [Hippocampus zosterae]
MMLFCWRAGMRDLGVFLLALFPAAMTLDFSYHSNREMESYLFRVNASNPDIAHLYGIGHSVAGQRLWVLALGLSPHRHALGVPEFKYVANMHGNEVRQRVRWEVHAGVKGRVLDCLGAALHNAVVEVSGRRDVRPFATDKGGEYYRLLLPGNYTLTVTCPGHEALTETFFVPYGPERNSALTHDFLLRRVTVATADPAPSSAPSPWTTTALGMALAFRGLID